MTILPMYNPLVIQDTVPLSELRFAAFISFMLGVTVGVVISTLLVMFKH